MTEFTLYWRDGTKNVVTGADIADAMNRAGFGAGAVRALDFYAKGDHRPYEWRDGEWHSTDPVFVATLESLKH